MWKGRVLGLVVAPCHALRMACASIIIQENKQGMRHNKASGGMDS